MDKVCAEAPQDYEETHAHYLTQEQKRLDKIRSDEEDRLKRLAAERAQRRHKRHLLRIERSKRKMKDDIENKVISRRTNEPDIWGLKIISFSDEDADMKKFRTYGGFLYELWAVMSNARTTLNKRVETPFEKFLLDDDQKKFMIHFLSENSLKDKSVRVTFHDKYKSQFDDALQQMDHDLLAFNDTKDQLISTLCENEDLVVGLGLELCIQHSLFDKEVLRAILKAILRIYFKSNNYKLPEEPKVSVDLATDQIAQGGIDPKTQSDDKPNGDEPVTNPSQDLVAPVDPTVPEDLTPVVAAGPPKRVIPEITEEDKKVEAIKKKLEIEFRAPESPKPTEKYSCIFRLRESLNRTAIRPEVKQRMEEQEQLKKEEASKSVDPKSDLKYHGRQYLLDEYLAKLKQEEEDRKLAEEAELAKQQDEYIENFYGDTYDRDLEQYQFEETERQPTNINESLAAGIGNVLFIHRVNQGILRKEIVTKLRETFKEMSLIKEVNIEQDIFPVDKQIEAEVFKRVVPDPEQVPIYDMEL